MRKLSAWDEEYTYAETNSIVSNLALRTLERKEKPPEGTSARLCWEHIVSCLTANDYRSLIDVDIDYSDNAWSASTLIAVRQALAYFSKRSNLEVGLDKAESAWSVFLESEEKCRETNIIFERWKAGEFRFSSAVESVLFLAQRKISSVLGDVPALSELALRFGPGANIGITKREASARSKLSMRPSCSTELEGYLTEVLSEMPLYCDLHRVSTRQNLEGDTYDTIPVDVVDGRIVFVPKSPKTYRTIGVEPFLNSMGQLAYGDYISDKLLRRGVDLHDQTLNQRLAREGSFTGDLATLDLSSASDTIALRLVEHLLPFDWVWQLQKFRTAHVISPWGKRLKLEKFSSMGNGFTFPLESLIFWALASSVDSSVVSVYGDDIVVDSSSVDLLMEVLNACGFTVNKSKSYWSGPFRESCGSDYYLGWNIRPVYVKENLTGQDLFRLHNFFHRKGDFEACSDILELVPEALRLWGPDGFGDGHLISDDPPLKAHGRLFGWGGYVFDTFTFKSRRCFKPSPGDSLLPSYSIYRRSSEPLNTCQLVLSDVFDENRVIHKNFRKEVLRRRFLSGLDIPLEPLPSNKKGTKGVSLPGTRGYKRISIYTLTPK